MSLKRDDLLLYPGPVRHCLILYTLKANIGNCFTSFPKVSYGYIKPPRMISFWDLSNKTPFFLDLFQIKC